MAARETTDGPAEKRGAEALDDRERAILDFERQWWKHAGAKEDAIRSEFALSSARYYQVLGALIDRREALVYDPMLVKRLQRLRDARSAARAARSTPRSSS
jgi:hypothetical protein